MLKNATDLAFYFSTDEINLFKKGLSHSIWPMILTCFNYNPYYRYQDPNVFYVGIIPGPHKPLDMNSFFPPLIKEFQERHKGIPTVLDGSTWEKHQKPRSKDYFKVHGYIVIAGADMSARDIILNFHEFDFDD